MANDVVIPTACQGCLSNCPVRVRVRDGAINEVLGNADSAATGGAVCANTGIAIEQCLDPDRVLHPLRRTNPRKGRHERPGFEQVSWDEALDEIADRLISLRNRGEGYRVAVAKGRSTGIGALFNSVFPEVYGTPNRFNHDAMCAQAESVGLGCLDGIWSSHEADIAHARYVLLWGTDPLSSNKQKANARRWWKRIRTQAKVVCIDPRLSFTAMRADEWLPVTPGTDAALACAMAHVIVSERLVNAPFVESCTEGLDVWWNEELCRTTPEWAEAECGIAADDIRRIAREFASQGEHALSWSSPGVGMAPHGVHATMAVHALNGLVGSLFTEGGLHRFPSVPLAKLPSTEPFIDDVARSANAMPPCDFRRDLGFLAGKGGRIHVNGVVPSVADAVLEGRPYALDTVIAYWVNWAYSSPDTHKWWDALSRLPFLAHVTTNLSETSMFADIVLPAKHHMFETWGFVQCKQNLHATVAIEQPCVQAPGEARNDEAGVVFGLAEKLADRGFDSLLRYCLSLVDPVTGAPPSNGEQLAMHAVKIMTEPAWKDAAGWEALRRSGVFNSDPLSFRKDGAPASFSTPSGKFEFSSLLLKAMVADYAGEHGLDMEAALDSLGIAARGNRAWVPHYEEPVRLGDPGDFPFIFTQHRSHASLEGRAANSPLFQQMKGSDPGDVPGGDVLKMNPADMGEMGLADGDMVRVSSVLSSIDVPVRAWEGVMPGVVAKCYGQGHWAYGHVAALDFENGVARGGNNNDLVPMVWERVSASTARHGGFVRVRVERVEEAWHERA